MGRVEINKKNKEEMIYKKGFQLFVDKGFVKTTIADIAKAAGLAKGTFYLYFKDKYELRDKLVVQKSNQILKEARESLRRYPAENFENKLLHIVDFVLDYLSGNTMMLKFINKNLSWGIFQSAVSDQMKESDQTVGMYREYLNLMKEDHIRCQNPELMLFTIIELVSATSYSCILYKSPASLETYLPYLHKSIHKIIEGFTE
jgi:AcrR family transcriptional regulator